MLKRELSDWPGGVESVWPLLDAESIRALRTATPPDSRALHVSSELEEEEVAGSAFVGDAMVLLRTVAEGGEGLRITSNGTLSLTSVASMRAAMTWADMEATEHYRDGTKYRERDLWELHLLRRMVQEAELIERGARSFELTALGRRMLDAGNRGALQALLFRVIFWHMDTSLFVGWFARRVPGRWPQNDIGVVLWALAGVADEWQSAGHARRVVHRSREPAAGHEALPGRGDLRVTSPGTPARSSSQRRAQLGEAEDQHERLALRERTEAPSLVECRRSLVERLDDDGTRSDHLGRSQRSSSGVGQQVSSQAPSLVARVDCKLPQQDNRDWFRHAPADARRHSASFDGTGCQAVAGDYAILVADDVRPGPALGLVQPGLSLQPGIQAGCSAVELRYVVPGIQRLRSGYRSHNGWRDINSCKRSFGSDGASSAATNAVYTSASNAMTGRSFSVSIAAASLDRSTNSVRVTPRIAAARSISARRSSFILKFT